jgi:hypothetical protein
MDQCASLLQLHGIGWDTFLRGMLSWDIFLRGILSFVGFPPSRHTFLRGILSFVGYLLSWDTCFRGAVAFPDCERSGEQRRTNWLLEQESAHGTVATQITVLWTLTFGRYSALGFEISPTPITIATSPQKHGQIRTPIDPSTFHFRDDQRQLSPTRLCTTCYEQLCCKYVT